MEEIQEQTQKNDFDDITGALKEDIEHEAVVNGLNQVITQANNFKIMQNTAGWAQIESFIKKQTEEMLISLKLEENFEKIRRLQALIIAFESVLNIIELSCLEAEKAKIELDKLIGPEN